MRSFDDIIDNCHIQQVERSVDGFRGLISLNGKIASIVASNGAGWEHVSISFMKGNKMPTWEDMCTLKEKMWYDDETVIQIHPSKDEYVNNLSNCLHLWRCTYKDMVLPPSCLVGVKKGQSKYELIQQLKEAYEIAGEELPVLVGETSPAL